MKKRADWLLLLLACGLATSACRREAVQRPNFLILFADDQRADTIGAWGNPYIKTPNIDRLAGEGFSFRANYNMGSSGGAVCIPSRAMLNSGRAYFRVPNNLEGVKLVPEALREQGYVTFSAGKWHNERPSWLRSFARGKAMFFGGMSDHTKPPIEDLLSDGKLGNQRRGEKFSSELFADAAVEFLEGYKDDAPFYAYLAFTSPHDPRQPPESYRRMYYDNRPPLPKNFMAQHPFDNGNMGGRDENLAPWPRTREVIGDQLAEYYGMVTHLDDQIGRVLQALQASGRAASTYVIYAADNGLAMGSHGLLGKQNIYEHSQRVPLIIGGPGVPKGQSTHALTYLVDVPATILRLASVDAPGALDGQDLAPLWSGQKKQLRDTLFLAYTNLMRSVRDHRYKLIRYPQIGYTQLFDLESDPDELNNLAETPGQAERVERMMKSIERWQKDLGDTQPLSAANPKPKHIDMTGTPRKPDPWQPAWIVDKYFR